MELLKQAILNKGKVLSGDVLKVDSFLNGQIDVGLVSKMGEEIYNHFKGCGVNKILTIEASGIGIACLTAQFFNCGVVFAKKAKTANMSGDYYKSRSFSYTHKVENEILVSKDFISEGDKVLIIDDFLAHGEACHALMDIVGSAKAKLVGIGIAIEKGYQGGGDDMRAKGLDVYSLAIIDSMENGKIVFRK